MTWTACFKSCLHVSNMHNLQSETSSHPMYTVTLAKPWHTEQSIFSGTDCLYLRETEHIEAQTSTCMEWHILQHMLYYCKFSLRSYLRFLWWGTSLTPTTSFLGFPWASPNCTIVFRKRLLLFLLILQLVRIPRLSCQYSTSNINN